MKLRLHGTPAECAAAAARLRRTPGLHVTDRSRPCPDRAGELVRVYSPSTSTQPAAATSSRRGGAADGLA